MVDVRIIYKEQLDYVTDIANDIIKHNASKEIMEYVANESHVEAPFDFKGKYDDSMDNCIRISWGEAYVYLDLDDNEKPTGDISYCNDDMGIEHYSTYQGTVDGLNAMSIEEAYEASENSWCYDDYEGKETGLKYVAMK